MSKNYIFNYIYSKYGDKIGIIVASSGSYPKRVKIGWALAADVLLLPNKEFHKVKDLTFVKEGLKILESIMGEEVNKSPIEEGLNNFVKELNNIDLPSSGVPNPDLINSSIIKNKEIRDSIITLALRRMNYNNWDYYCDRKDSTLSKCDLRENIIAYKNRGKDTPYVIIDEETAKIIRQGIRTMEYRAYKYFKKI